MSYTISRELVTAERTTWWKDENHRKTEEIFWVTGPGLSRQATDVEVSIYRQLGSSDPIEVVKAAGIASITYQDQEGKVHEIKNVRDLDSEIDKDRKTSAKVFLDGIPTLPNQVSREPLEEDRKAREAWRVGGKIPINVYEHDLPRFQCHTGDDAARIVQDLNQANENRGIRFDLRRLVDLCYQEFLEQPGSVPSTEWADKIIEKAGIKPFLQVGSDTIETETLQQLLNEAKRRASAANEENERITARNREKLKKAGRRVNIMLGLLARAKTALSLLLTFGTTGQTLSGIQKNQDLINEIQTALDSTEIEVQVFTDTINLDEFLRRGKKALEKYTPLINHFGEDPVSSLMKEFGRSE